MLKILLVVLVVTWPAAIALLWYPTYATKQTFLKYSGNYFTQSLNNYATAIDQKLLKLQDDTKILSGSSAATDYLNQKTTANLTRLNQEVQTVHDTTGPWQALYITDANGKIVSAPGKNTSQVGQSVFALENFGGNFLKLKDSGKAISEGQSVSGSDSSSYVSLLTPVKAQPGGRVIGYVAGVYSLEEFSGLLNISDGNHIHLYNQQAERIAMVGSTPQELDHTDIDKQYMQNQNSNQPALINTGKAMIVVVLPSFSSGTLGQLNWRLVGSLNTKHLLADVDRHNTEVFVATVSVLVFIDLVLILYITYAVTRPISRIKCVAQSIAAGNYEQRAEVSSRSDAIGRLQHAINDMAMALTNERSHLKQMVEAKTHQLSEKVVDLKVAKSEIEQARNEDDALLSSIGDGVFAVDTQQKIILFNKAASRITGFSSQEVIGRKYQDALRFVVKNSHDHKPSFIEKSLHGQASVMPRTTYVSHKQGQLVPVADSSSPVIQNGKVKGVIVVFRDITKELEIDTAKNEFVSLASHQLRTPLTAISWYSELLLSGKFKDLNQEEKKYLKEIATGNKRMIELVNALLNLSRIELGTVAVEPTETDLKKIIASVADELSLRVKQQAQSLKVSVPKNLPSIQSDPQLVRTILQNLVSNSVKYTPEKGSIVVQAALNTKATAIAGHKVGARTIVVTVTDNGYGIPTKAQSKVFTKLYRADNIKTKNTDGTGLGLYMSKLLAHNLHCKLWFVSKVDKGTTFYLVLPLNAKLRKTSGKQLEK